MANQPKTEIKIEISPEVAAGHYANMAFTNYSPTEFVFDFIQMMPNMPQARVQSRIIMTPENAKNLLFHLRDSLEKYEGVFGEITRTEPKNAKGGNGFSA